MTANWDVLGLGCTTVDDLLYVQRFPETDQKTPIARAQRQCGGLTGTALVAAARMGAKCAYGGLLGHDEYSQVVAANFQKHGIEISTAARPADAGTIHSTIIVGVEDHTRNIFFQRIGRIGAEVDHPPADVIASSRVLLVDHYGVEGNLRAIGIARPFGVETVGDLERDELPGFAELLDAVGHAVLSERFALRITGAATAKEAVGRLWSAHRRAVVITCGENGCWYAEARDQPPRFQPAFRVNVVDTTGCGDVFHGVYCAELACGVAMDDRIRTASAAAAIKAMSEGGQAGIADRSGVEEFLRTRG
jgi:sugar/nucleoside kinase (ribokinase family)